MQYEFGGRSAYAHIVESDGTRRMHKHWSITDVAAAVRNIPGGTPVPASEVPDEPPLSIPTDVSTGVPTGAPSVVPTTPQEAAAAGFGHEASGAADDDG